MSLWSKNQIGLSHHKVKEAPEMGQACAAGGGRLSAARRDGSRRLASIRSLSTSPSPSHCLLPKLLRVPTSQIKETLDVNYDSALETPGFSWDALVSNLSSSSRPRANLVLEWKLERLVKLNEASCDGFLDLISQCAKVSNVSLAMRVFVAMEARGIEPTTCSFNCLIRCCLCSGEVLTALSVFEIMQRSERFSPDGETYDVFVSGFSSLRDVERMKAWFDAKRVAGFDANAGNYEAIVSGCVSVGDFNGADGFYSEMVAAGIMPGTAVLESVIEGLCRRRKCDSVMEFLKFLLECGFKVNGNMVQKMVEMYSELGRVDGLEKLLEILMPFFKEGDVLSRVHSGIIRMHAKSDMLEDVEYAVGRMMSQGMSFRSSTDIETVISMYFRKEAYESLDLFLEHVKRYYKLTRSTYDLLIAGYKRAGLGEKLDLVMEDMKLVGQ